MALDKPNTSLDSDVYLYSVSTKELKHLTPHQGQVAFSTAAFDPAASALYFLTDEGGEFKFVRRYGRLIYQWCRRWALTAEYDYYHFSNAGITRGNLGVNAFGGTVGITRFLR